MTTLDPARDTASDLLVDRAAALEASGWGNRLPLWQPRNLAYWVYLLIVGAGALIYGTYFTGQSGWYGPALVAAGVLFGLYGALFWWFTVHIDRYAGVPGSAIVLAVVWGAFGAAGAIASNANTPLIDLLGVGISPGWAQLWGAGIAAPIVEELAKGAGVLLLLVLGRRVVRTAFDGFVLGAFSGLGFLVVEDVQYALGSAAQQFGADQIGNALGTIELRLATGFVGHILYSAVFGAGLLWFLGTPTEPRRRLRGLAFMLAAMLLHGLWDSAIGVGTTLLGGSTPLVFGYWIVVAVLAVATVVTAFRLAVPRERGFVRAVLAPEVSAGVLTEEELATLSGDAKARRAYRRAAHGYERRRRHHRLAAAHELADELARAGGEETSRVIHAREELARFAPA